MSNFVIITFLCEEEVDNSTTAFTEGNRLMASVKRTSNHFTIVELSRQNAILETRMAVVLLYIVVGYSGPGCCHVRSTQCTPR